MTHGGGGDRSRRRDINDELIAGVVEVVRSSCGEREEVVERELSCCRLPNLCDGQDARSDPPQRWSLW